MTSDREVVFTVRLSWAGPEESTWTVEEENEHVAPAGAPLQASETGTSNPFKGVRVKV
jgi:hypothetical protein